MNQMNGKSSPLASTAAVLVLLCGLFLNLDGYHIHIASPWSGRGDFKAELPSINWVHGWPMGFAVRSSIYSPKAGKGVPITSITGELGYYSRWPFDNAPMVAFNAGVAVIDCALCTLVVLGTYLGMRRLAARFGWRLRYSTRTLLIIMGVTSLGLFFRYKLFTNRLVFEASAAAVVLVGVSLCLIALVPKKWLSTHGPEPAQV
jgi:hypothetical protein